MRLLPPLFLLHRLGRMNLQHRAASASPDPADMGTEFGLEATLADMAPLVAPARAAACDEPPLAWLGRTTARRSD